MSTSPYMKFYFADYDSDTANLTTFQHGAYFLLIKAYWQSGKPLPDDDRQLARIARCSMPQWMRFSKLARSFFITSPDGFLIHKRIEDELEKYRTTSNTRKHSGGKGGRAKALANARRLLPYSEPEEEQERTNRENRDNLSRVVKEDRRSGGKEDSTSLRSAPTTTGKGKLKAEENGQNGHAKPANHRGSGLPPDWEPEVADISVGYALGMEEQRARLESAKFGDYWRAQPGAKGLKLDWNATFRNWLRKAATS